MCKTISLACAEDVNLCIHALIGGYAEQIWLALWLAQCASGSYDPKTFSNKANDSWVCMQSTVRYLQTYRLKQAFFNPKVWNPLREYESANIVFLVSVSLSSVLRPEKHMSVCIPKSSFLGHFRTTSWQTTLHVFRTQGSRDISAITERLCTHIEASVADCEREGQQES